MRGAASRPARRGAAPPMPAGRSQRRPHPPAVAAELIQPRADQAPAPPVVVERARRRREHLPLLRVIQHPVQVLVGWRRTDRASRDRSGSPPLRMIARALSRSPRPTAAITLSETIAGLVGASATARSAAESAAGVLAEQDVHRRQPARYRQTSAGRVGRRGRAVAAAPSHWPRLVSALASALSRSTLSGARRSPWLYSATARWLSTGLTLP